MERVFQEVKGFFASGVFYIVVGSAFLYVSYQISLANRAHTAFVFLLAVLGVALVLFGTGTQAAGSGTAGSVKVAIAGGAGVLAFVLGFGIVSYGKELGDVFKRSLDYGVLKLAIDPLSATSATTNLDDFEVHARSGSEPLHLFNDNQVIEILVPINETGASDVTVSLRAKPGTPELRPTAELSYLISWYIDKDIRKEAGFNNELVVTSSKPINLSRTSQLPVEARNDRTGAVDRLDISPQ